MKKHEKYKGSESSFQITMANYLNHLDVIWFHPPNGGSRNMLEAKKLKREGVKSGVPDIIILEPKGGYHGLFLELKVGYNKPGENQIEFINKSNKKGYLAKWTNSLEEAIEIIEKYMKL